DGDLGQAGGAGRGTGGGRRVPAAPRPPLRARPGRTPAPRIPTARPARFRGDRGAAAGRGGARGGARGAASAGPAGGRMMPPVLVVTAVAAERDAVRAGLPSGREVTVIAAGV